MEGEIRRATRTTVFVALFMAAIMLLSPAFDFAGKSVNLGASEDAAAANPGARTMQMGIVDMKGSVSTLNPLLYTMAEEMIVIWLCYSTLLVWDVNAQEMLPDIARTYTISPNGLFWNFTLVDNAVFYDKNKVALGQPLEKVTALDVIYSFDLIMNQTKNNLHSYFPKVGGQNVIKSMSYGPTVYDLHIQLAMQYAPFSASLTSLPILPRYIWYPYANPGNNYRNWNWDNYDTGVSPLIGSGAFVYDTPGLPQGLSIELIRSPTWYATEERGWQSHVNKLILYSETSDDTNLNDFTTGVNDLILYVSADQYINVLSKPAYADVSKFAPSTGFVYEFNLNQMTPDMRTQGSPYARGTNNQLLQDPVVKRAMAMCVNKQEFIDQVRGGLGSPADTLVPKSHPYNYHYGSNPARDTELVTFDPLGARTLLRNHGWTYDVAGNYVPEWDTDTYPLCKFGGADPLQFRMYTLSESPEWNKGARLIADWESQGGVDLLTLYEIKSTNQMNGIWAAADYDCWLWDWDFAPNDEISVDILEVMTTGSFGSWQDIYWSNSTYDALYNQTLVTMDPVARKLITDEMQRIAYEAMACQLVAWRATLYAGSGRGTEHWGNYGNWASQWTLIPDQNYPYLYMRVQPADNLVPRISGVSIPSTGQVGTSVPFTATCVDTPQDLEYRWFFDNKGSNSSWKANDATESWTYTKDGVYTVWFAVRERTGADKFSNFTSAKITISDNSNTPPRLVDFGYTPSTGIDASTVVTLTATGIDDNPGDQIYYHFDFGDGFSLDGKVVQHQFILGQPAIVNLTATDNRYGSGTRPAKASHTINVAPNDAPSISVPDRTDPQPNAITDFWVIASDTENYATMRYTWNWGDGSLSVTNGLSGNMTTHRYRNQGVYTMTVFADDLTNIPGHNKSDTGQILVQRKANAAPAWGASGSADGFGVSPTTRPVRFQTLTFTANATDANKDDLTFTFYFGDATSQSMTVVCGGPGGDNAYATATHAYTTTGAKSAYATVTDGFATNTSSTKLIIVAVGDREPVITHIPNRNCTVGTTQTFTATATDPDSDTMVYSWQWQYRNATGRLHFDGKGGQTTTYSWLNASGAAGYLFRVWVNDTNTTSIVGPMNVSESAYAYVNWVPWIEYGLQPVSSLKGLTDRVFNLTVWDNDSLDNTSLVCTWNFGDGTIVSGVGLSSVTHQFVNPLVSQDYTVRVWIDDGFHDDYGVAHNVTMTALVHVVHKDTIAPVTDSGGPYSGAMGQLMTFDGSGTTDAGGSVVLNYTWTITNATDTLILWEETAQYVFWSEGSWTVSLNVTDEDGNYDVDTTTLVIAGLIPEFPALILPVIGVLGMFVAIEAYAHKQK